MKEIITLCVGQCGNQIGSEFWKQITANTASGLTCRKFAGCSRKDIFFYEADDAASQETLLLDLEPRVVNNIQNSNIGTCSIPRTYLFRKKAAAQTATGRRGTGRRRRTRSYC